MTTWTWTNEPLEKFAADLDVRGKSVLSICAGGDMALTFLLNGAKFVDVFDKTIKARFDTEIKIATMRQYKKFDTVLRKMAAFDSAAKKVDILKKNRVWNKISPQMRALAETWDSAGYNTPFGNGRRPFDENIAHYKKIHKLVQGMSAPPLGEFIWRDLAGMSGVGKKYDVIYLSNIPEYGGFDWNAVMETLSPILPDGGQVIGMSGNKFHIATKIRD